MQEILVDYRLNPTTGTHISALMMFGICFKFHKPDMSGCFPSSGVAPYAVKPRIAKMMIRRRFAPQASFSFFSNHRNVLNIA
jgi:hypothetical protein